MSIFIEHLDESQIDLCQTQIAAARSIWQQYSDHMQEVVESESPLALLSASNLFCLSDEHSFVLPKL